MLKNLRLAAVVSLTLAAVLCGAVLGGCGNKKIDEKYEEKIEVDSEKRSEIELSLATFTVDSDDVTLAVDITNDKITNATVTLKTELLEEAEYRDAGDVICYTGKTKLQGKKTENIEIPAKGHSFHVENGAAADGKTRMVTISVRDKMSGTVGEGTLLIRNGVVLLTEMGIGKVLEEMTDEEMASLVVGYYGENPVPGSAGATTPIARLGIPLVSLADGPQGVRLATPTVWYPCGANIASSWDRQNIYNVGKAIGRDCDAMGADVILGPGMNIQRVVLGGRNFEYYSEDPYITGIAAVAYASGVQSEGIGVSGKHYAANNQESARGVVSARINERAVREIYLRGFGYLVRKADPLTIMSSYNRLNGTYTSVNRPLLNVLRNEFGFRGLVMSDWGSGGAVTDKVNAGNDLTEPGTADQYSEILAAMKTSQETKAECIECCKRILSVVAQSKAYEKMLGGKKRTSEEPDFEKSREAALEAAESGMVLLKNEGNALPVKEQSKLALIGMAAYDPVYGGSGSGGVYTSCNKSIETGLLEAGYFIETKAALWFAYSNKIRKEFDEEAPNWAETCEAAVIAISRRSSEGEDNPSGEGGFLLDENEKAMIGRVSEVFHEKGKKVIVLLNTGDPVETVSWRDSVDAILWTGYPGESFGTALANIISGKTAPSGKLTCTWPETYESTPYYYDFPGTGSVTRYRDDVYVGYRFYEKFGVNVAYPFGHGLTYTRFEYSDFTAHANADGSCTLSVTVKNTGDREGREVVQFYVTKPDSEELLSLKKELCGFDKTATLKPGERATISAIVTNYELESFFTSDMSWKVISGEYEFMAAASSSDVRASSKVTVAETKTTRQVEEKLNPGKDVDVIEPGQIAPYEETRTNIAKNCDTYCNGVEGGHVSKNMVDGEKTTRWSAAGTSGEKWVVVDLGEVRNVSDITILWESNSAYSYKVEISADDPEEKGKPGTKNIPSGVTWTTVLETDMLDWDLDRIDIKANARFIRVSVPETAGWCSIYELSVYGGN